MDYQHHWLIVDEVALTKGNIFNEISRAYCSKDPCQKKTMLAKPHIKR